MSFQHQLNEVCQSSSLSNETMGNKVADFRQQITLLSFKFNELNSALKGSQQMSLHSKITSLTFKANTKENVNKPSLCPGVKMV